MNAPYFVWLTNPVTDRTTSIILITVMVTITIIIKTITLLSVSNYCTLIPRHSDSLSSKYLSYHRPRLYLSESHGTPLQTTPTYKGSGLGNPRGDVSSSGRDQSSGGKEGGCRVDGGRKSLVRSKGHPTRTQKDPFSLRWVFPKWERLRKRGEL